MIGDLRFVYRRECSITFIDGAKRDGKTNLALKLIEDGLALGYWSKVATNIDTQGELEFIPYYDDLEDWAKKRGARKAYLLDEVGKHLSRVRFMTELSKVIFDLIQLAGHFDLHLFGCCPSEGLVDKLFLNTDILDIKIRKLGKKTAKVWNYVTKHYGYKIHNIPATRIPYDSKDVAKFIMNNPDRGKTEFQRLRKCCQCARLYMKLRSFRKVAKEMGCSFQLVPQLLDKHLQHLK